MKFVQYISLARPLNLLIIVAILFASRYYIIDPFLDMNSMDLIHSVWQFLVLVISIILISAYGYVSNDQNDIRTDTHNNKDRILVKDPGLRSKTENYAFLLLLIGLFLGLISWVIVQNWMLVLIHCFAGASLFAYSKYLKKTVLLGNVSIALLCAVLPLIVFLFDMPSVIQIHYETKGVFLLNNGTKTYNEVFFRIILRTTLILSLFIFLFTLMREVIKDIQDISGDRVAGYRTLAVRFGARLSKHVVIGIGVFMIVILFGILGVSLRNYF